MKIKGFQAQLRRQGLDAALIFSYKNSDPNLRYFTGMDLEYSFLIIPAKGPATLVTSRLEHERAKRYSLVRRVKKFDKPAFRFVAGILKRAKVIGINKSVVSLNEYKLMRQAIKSTCYRDIGALLVTSRKRKYPEEIATLRRACAAADSIFAKLVHSFHFQTEQDISEFLKSEAEKLGGKPSFDPIVASGRCSSMPHYRGLDVKLRKGFCVIDFGVDLDGYKSDITRTIHIGKASAAEKASYELLRTVQEDCIKAIRPGMRASKLAEIANAGLGKYQKNFIHGLGHGIGVEIHELPNLVPGSKDILLDGDVFTVEPGIYFPGRYGIRIEDDILIHKGKAMVLTKSTRRLIEVRR
jgi:Xaa-Pro aminopeptidase